MSANEQTTRTLYMLALQADARYSATVTARTGRTRWTMRPEEEQIAEVREAYRAKVNADEAWLMYLRHASKGEGR